MPGTINHSCRCARGLAQVLTTDGVSVVLGSQWGDEGKGKLVDILAQHADYVCRFVWTSRYPPCHHRRGYLSWCSPSATARVAPCATTLPALSDLTWLTSRGMPLPAVTRAHVAPRATSLAAAARHCTRHPVPPRLLLLMPVCLLLCTSTHWTWPRCVNVARC